MAVVRVALALAVLSACQFDEGGIPHPVGGADSGTTVDTPSPADAAVPDAYRPDATPPCVDDDGDSYPAGEVPGVDCGPTSDCDDTDPRAHPGQQDYFDTPRTSGGFDFDCDGLESPLDTAQGFECAWDWFYCAGTGWLGTVPACGQEGTYHWCQPDWERCEEASVQTGRMPCR